MGLGPGWVVLNVLNAFAAYRAGASPRSLSICGDDLVGYWAPEICDRYEANLELLGLQANKDKSFRGKKGVFCERPVCIVGKQAIARNHVRPGQVIAKASRRQKWAAQCDNMVGLKCSKLLHREAQFTRKLCRSPHIPGLFSQGGTSGTRANHVTLLSYVTRGAIPVTPGQLATKDIEVSLFPKKHVAKEAGVPIDNVLQAVRREARRQMFIRREFKPPREVLTAKEISIIGAKRRSYLRPILRKKPIAALKSLRQEGSTILSRMTQAEFTRVTRFVSQKRYGAAIRVVQNSTFLTSPAAVKTLFRARNLECEPPVQLTMQPTRQVWNSRPK